MGTISQLLKAVQSVSLETEVPKIIEATSGEIIALNQGQLYEKSIDSNGLRLALYSSPIYALQKEKQNPLPGFLHPDLKLTGSLYGAMYVEVTPNAFTVGSKDFKEPEIEAKYGKYIWGLTKENKIVYSEIVYAKIRQYITEKTGLTFS